MTDRLMIYRPVSYSTTALLYLVGGFDADEGLSEWHWSEAAVEEEEANVGVDMEEGGHIQVVGQCG